MIFQLGPVSAQDYAEKDDGPCSRWARTTTTSFSVR